MTVPRLPSERWRLAGIAGLMLAVATPGLAFGTTGAPLELELTRDSLATADFGDARLRGAENRLSISGPPMPAGERGFRWALHCAYQRYECQGLPSRNRDLHRLEIPLRLGAEVVSDGSRVARPVGKEVNEHALLFD